MYLIIFCFFYKKGIVSYTCAYNVLDFPAGSLPVTKVTKEDVKKMADYPGNGLWYRTIKKVLFLNRLMNLGQQRV